MGTRPRLNIALAVALVLGSAGSIGATAPVVAGEVERQMAREVFGFFDASDREYMLQTADYDVLSTVAFFSFDARSDGTLATTLASGAPNSAHRAWHSDWMGQVIDKAHAHGCKVVLTITRFGWRADDRATSVALLASEEARATLIDQIADQVMARGADGVNLDFEPMYAEVDEEFVALVRGLRAELDSRRPGLSLTFDSPGYSNNYLIGPLTADGAADAVLLMAYPFATLYVDRAGAISPMGGLPFDVTEAVDRQLSQTTPDKVILGLPNYGYHWPTETKYRHGTTRPDWATYGRPKSISLTGAAALATTYGARWDPEQLVAWTRWRARACSTCPRTWRQVYYDDTRSTSIKYDYANERDVRGIGVWKLGFGTDRADFYSLMRAKFGVPEPPAQATQ